MNMTKFTTHKTVDYSLSDVVACLVFQILTVVLLKLIADTFGMIETIFAAVAYIASVVIFGCNIITYFFLDRPAIALTTLFTYTALGIRCSTISFYFHDYINQQALAVWLHQLGINVIRADASTIGLIIFITIGICVQVLGISLLNFLMPKQLKKKEIYVSCLAATALLTVLCYLPQPDDISLIFILSMVKSLVFAPTIPLLCAMTSNVEDRTKLSSFSILSTIKIGMGLGSALTGIFLFSFGYASFTHDIMSWYTIQGIRWLSSLIPALFFVFSIAIILLYPKTKTNDSAFLNYFDDII